MPTGRGGNLTQPLKKVLINQPSPDNLGAYTDTTTGLRVLQFMRDGYSLPWLPNGTITAQLPQGPILKLAVLQLSNVAPLNPLSYAYGVTILKRVRKPGIDNSDYFPHQKYYGGVLPSVTIPTIANAELNDMRDDIILQVNADRGYTRKHDFQHPGASVIASAAAVLNTWNDTSAGTIDGEAVAAAANIGAFIDNINAVDGYVAFEDPDTAGNIIVFGTDVTNPVPPVWATTAGNIVEVATNGLIGFAQRYDDATFELKVSSTLGATRTIRDTTFAFLTNDEVFQQFSHIPNLGTLAQETWPQKTPLQGVPYARINIDINYNHYDLGGASHVLGFTTALELYMPAAEWGVAIGGGVNDRWLSPAGGRFLAAGAQENVRDLIAWWTA